MTECFSEHPLHTGLSYPKSRIVYSVKWFVMPFGKMKQEAYFSFDVQFDTFSLKIVHIISQQVVKGADRSSIYKMFKNMHSNKSGKKVHLAGSIF